MHEKRPSRSDRSPVAPRYREEQHFRQWWVWVLIGAPAALAWWPFIQQIIGGEPAGQNPAPDWAVWLIWLFIGLGLPLLFGRMFLLVEVTETDVSVRYWPFVRRTISFEDITSVRARTYSALKEYGGWGVKGWTRANMAYNVSGNRGVELTLADGRRLLLGSQRPEELAAVIESGLRGKSRP